MGWPERADIEANIREAGQFLRAGRVRDSLAMTDRALQQCYRLDRCSPQMLASALLQTITHAPGRLVECKTPEHAERVLDFASRVVRDLFSDPV